MTLEEIKKLYPHWNWDEVDEIAEEDIMAAAEMFDIIMNKRKKDETENDQSGAA
jgi:predicted DNA-binding ribbon-helix-helix protein